MKTLELTDEEHDVLKGLIGAMSDSKAREILRFLIWDIDAVRALDLLEEPAHKRTDYLYNIYLKLSPYSVEVKV